MSTLPEYTRYGLMAGWQSPSARPDLSRISQSATDEYDGFVVLNKQNGGSTISNSVAWIDDFGTQFTPHYNGCVSDNFELFNFSDRDFTVRMQFGIGQYYAYNDLEGEQTIPLLFVDTGDGIVSTSPFSLYMANAGNPNGVQQGDLVFSVFDTNGNQAYCHISPSNYYLPTYPGCWHVEVSRRGQQFTFKLTAYDSGEVIRVVRNTFPSFGKIAPANGVIRLLTFVDYGTVNNVFYGLQITDGVSRDTGGNSVFGRYATGRAYPSKSVRQRTKFELINAPLVGVVAGHTVNERIAGALRVALQDAIWGQYEYVNGTLGVDVPGIFATLTYAPYDYESVTKYLDYDFTDSDTLTVSGGYVTAVTDKSGNSRNATAVGGGPALTSGAINGLQAVTISSGRYLNLSTHLLSLIDGGNKFYVVVVYKPVYNSAGYKPILLQQSVAGSGWRYLGVYETFASSSSHYSEFIYSGTNYVQKSTYGWQYVIYEADPSTLKLGRVDGEEVFSVTPGAVGAYTGTPSAYIGGDADSSEPTYFNGQIARLSIIEAESLDMEGVEQWIARTFALPVPEDHRYYGYFYPVDDEVSCTDTSSPTGNLLANDVAIECTLSVSAVSGVAGNVGVAQTLTNGTVVTINADGSYTIDPTGCDTSGGDVVDTIEYSVGNGDAEASAGLTVTVTASEPEETDPYWDNVVLCINAQGDDGSTNIADEKGATITRYGNTQVDDSLGYPTILFDGSGDYFTLPTGANFNFGTSDFTIEFFVRIPSGTGLRDIINKFVTWATNVDFRIYTATTSRKMTFVAGDSGPIAIQSDNAFPVDTMTHVAICRESGVTRMFIDGSQQAGTHSGSANIPNDRTTLTVGYATGGQYMLGHIRAIRITAAARYSSSFTPPDVPFPTTA